MMFGLTKIAFALADASARVKDNVYVGIDLGTTFTCVCLFIQRSKSYEFLNFGRGLELTVPSTVFVDNNKNTHVGFDAENKNEDNPLSHRYFYGFKRLVGLTADNEIVDRFRKNVTYECAKEISGQHPIVVFPVRHDDGTITKYSPTDFSMLILQMIRNKIEEDYNIVRTVITTPAYFSVTQDSQTRIAAENAGFAEGIIDIFKEPTAACIEYAQTSFDKLDKEEKILVFDLGGGTFDISILEVENEKEDSKKRKVYSNITVAKYSGDNFLGGENVNSCICDSFRKQIISRNPERKELTANEELRLRLFVERLKIKACTEFAQNPSATVNDIFFDANEQKYPFSLTKASFDALAMPVYTRIDALLFDRSTGLFRTGNVDTYDKPVAKEDIEKIVLVGGSTRIPYIKEYLKKKFPKAIVSTEVDADKSVAKGACIMCVNSDDASGEQSVMLLNATTLPIGIAVHDGSFKAILEKDIVIPTESSEIFSTVDEYQKRVTVRVATGVRPLFSDNEEIGLFDFEIKHPGPKGSKRIEVKMSMASNYVLTVTATDLDHQQDTITKVFKENYVGTDKKKVAEILERAKSHEETDKETLRKLEAMRVYTSGIELFEKQLNEAKLVENKIVHTTVLDTHKEWLKTNKETATSEEIEGQVENLKKDTEALAEDIKKAPTEEQKRENL